MASLQDQHPFDVIDLTRESKRMNSSMVIDIPANYSPTYLESLWLDTFKDSEYPGIKLALVLFVWHEIVFIGRYIPFLICDYIPYFRQYKIQEKENSRESILKCVKHVLLAQVFVELPMMMLFHPVAITLGMKFLSVPFPSIQSVALANIFFLFMEDFYQYFVHRLLHYGILYKKIHKLHHEFSAPFGLASQYAHPAETLILGLGFFLGPLCWIYYTGDLHVMTMAIWLAIRLLQVVDSHSGYDFPWSLHNFLPFWAGADFHDYHHRAFVGNYSSSFRWWDWIFGTDSAYAVFKKKSLASKKSKKMN